MKNLAKAIVSENEKNNAYKLELINSINIEEVGGIDFISPIWLDWRLKELLTAGQMKKEYKVEELKEVLKSRNKKAQEKKNLKDLEKLNFVNFVNLEDIETLTINVEWKRSQMWGMNPTAEAYVNGIGHVSSGSISGCGYDKQSTAVARVLNQVPQLIKKLYELKENNIDIKNHDLFGYGSGYGVLPSFEGGVGVSCYNKIFDSIGYEFKTISNGKTFDVYQISRKKE